MNGRPMSRTEREAESHNFAFEADHIRAAERAADDDLNLDISEDMEREFSPQRKDTNMANTTPSYGLAPAPERVSPFDELCSTVGAFRATAARIASLADKIAGAVPRAVSGAEDKRGASGLVDVIEIANENMRDIGLAIAEDLQRIEARL